MVGYTAGAREHPSYQVEQELFRIRGFPIRGVQRICEYVGVALEFRCGAKGI